MQIARNSIPDRSPVQKEEDVGDDEDQRTLFCANLSELVTEELLYELFIQSGPVESVRIPKDKDGRNRQFGFVTFAHACTVEYAIELYAGVRLFNRDLVLRYRNNQQNARNQTLGKRRRIDSNSLADDKSPQGDNRSTRLNEPHSTSKRFLSEADNPLRMGGGRSGFGNKTDHSMRPQQSPSINMRRNVNVQGDQMNLNELAKFGANLFNPFKNNSANSFDNALKDALSTGSGKRNSGGERGKHHGSDGNNRFRPNQNAQHDFDRQNRGRHGDNDDFSKHGQRNQYNNKRRKMRNQKS